MSFDTIIRGGTVVDGSGLPRRRADVGIKQGTITDIGRLSGARRTIDADGLVVMPGIVDAHTHYDPQLSFDPWGTSSCFHGVTSVVAGNCGYSIAPCRPEDHEWVTSLFAKVEGMSPGVLREGLPWDWESFPSFLQAIDKRLGINAAVYIGHSALRRFVMGEGASERAATADEIERMRGLVREAMAAGAAGFSSSHAPTHVDHLGRPVPSRRASFDEVYAARYGYANPAEPVEIVTWKLSAIGGSPRIALAKAAASSADGSRKGMRRAYFPETRGYADTPVYDRYALAAGTSLTGPAIVEERESTLVVGPGGRFEVAPSGNIIVSIG